ncbi:MAG: JmjC domain-containing protein [Bacteriovoracia bacterium]
MEFKPGNNSSKLTTYNEQLLEAEEVQQIFCNEFLHDIGSFYIVEPDGTYRDDEKFSYGTAVFKMKQIEESYHKGLTILVKNLENWNEKIQRRCKELGESTNVHMYLSPGGGSGFDWHNDDRDVYVHMQMGQKHFEVKEPDGKISSYDLTEKSCLYMPYAILHRASAGNAPSVHLSFGVWPKGMTVQKQYQGIDFPIKLL